MYNEVGGIGDPANHVEYYSNKWYYDSDRSQGNQTC